MTFLELCQRLRAECQDLGSGPDTVTGQSGRMLTYVTAIREAWVKVQLSRTDWEWLRTDPATPLQSLAADGDSPFIEEPYHMAIVWLALRGLSLSQVTTELRIRAEEEWSTYHSMLVRRYVPATLTFGNGGGEW
ncbi:hypothetical protein SAMN05880558_11328 [Aeromonas sp. RU39B]|uniref:hypothetical protein n=1 Tax=Aeromonas sp. RU39B TaxID=1907416 RepID=UPI0009546547|nr:hypothetical protein [Aeromonas sp. RU39B]SIR40067.1 hypothetical protein SAMN05880558_11328 [Aeromonas sp. RU39B]